MHGSFYSEKMHLLPFSLLIENVILGGMDRNKELPISVRLAMCPAERDRDPLGCRASGLTPELPLHVVMFSPLLVPQLLRLQALVPGVQRQRITIAMSWISIASFYFARFGGFEKGLDFNRAVHGIFSRRIFSRLFAAPNPYWRERLPDGHIAMKFNKTTYTSGINQYSLQSTVATAV